MDRHLKRFVGGVKGVWESRGSRRARAYLARVGSDGQGSCRGTVRVCIDNNRAQSSHIKLVYVWSIVKVDGLITVDFDWRRAVSRAVFEQYESHISPEVGQVKNKGPRSSRQVVGCGVKTGLHLDWDDGCHVVKGRGGGIEGDHVGGGGGDDARPGDEDRGQARAVVARCVCCERGRGDERAAGDGGDKAQRMDGI